MLIITVHRATHQILCAAIAAVTLATSAAWASPNVYRYAPDPNAKEKAQRQLDHLAAAHERIAPAVAKDTTFMTLMGSEGWENINPTLRVDDDDKFKSTCMYGWFDAGKFNAFRANNLAANGHYDEAIAEIN